MEYNYTLRLKAEQDIDSILDYIAQDNPDAALKLYSKFLRQFEYLSVFPEVGCLRDEFTPNMRSLAVGNYTIYFHKTEPVEIVRVLHGARLVSDQFFQV